jgi:hypothetical protein
LGQSPLLHMSISCEEKRPARTPAYQAEERTSRRRRHRTADDHKPLKAPENGQPPQEILRGSSLLAAQPRDFSIFHLHENNDSPASRSFLRLRGRASESSCSFQQPIIRNVCGKRRSIALRGKICGLQSTKNNYIVIWPQSQTGLVRSWNRL